MSEQEKLKSCPWCGPTNGWESIETAPKDGTPILALTFPFRKKDPYKGLHILHFKGKTFRYHHTPSRIFEGQRYIKYWMPLPKPPEVE